MINQEANQTYKVLGTTQDVTNCECCGRTDLNKTVILGALDADGNVQSITHFGITCASYAARRTTKEIKELAKTAEQAKIRANMAASYAKGKQYTEGFTAWLTEQTGIDANRYYIAAARAIGGLPQAHRLYAAHVAA